MNQSVCTGDTVHFSCVVMFTRGSPGPAIWLTNNGDNDASRELGHSLTDDSNYRSAPANVTTVLTVTNVRISNNGADYVCVQGLNTRSDTAFLTVFGELQVCALLHGYDFSVITYTISYLVTTYILCSYAVCISSQERCVAHK